MDPASGKPMSMWAVGEAPFSPSSLSLMSCVDMAKNRKTCEGGSKIKLELKMKSCLCSPSLSLKLFVLSPSGAKEERRMQD